MIFHCSLRLTTKSDIRQNPQPPTAYVHLSTLRIRSLGILPNLTLSRKPIILQPKLHFVYNLEAPDGVVGSFLIRRENNEKGFGFGYGIIIPNSYEKYFSIMGKPMVYYMSL